MLPSSYIDRERLWRRHEDIARFGAIPNNGVNRQAFSHDEIAARRQLLDWGRARNYTAGIDPAGNLFMRRPGRHPHLPPVLTGSHLDTQPRGGRFDGTFGVLAAFEALEALDDAGLQTERPIDIVAWSNEEGCRFRPGTMGSQAFVGLIDLSELKDLRDQDGILLLDALETTLKAFSEVPRRSFGTPVHAYLEAHIEQGPILETAGAAIGIVTGVAGARWYEVTIIGETAHAGTTPLSLRRDALQGAVRSITEMNKAMADADDQLRFTIGRFDVDPNVTNSIAARVDFTIDLRHPDANVLKQYADRIYPCCDSAASPCKFEIKEVMELPPVAFDVDVRNTIEARAAALGLNSRSLPSGAFHDATFLSNICSTGMIFIPCERGISHNEAENVAVSDVYAGAQVLADAVYTLAGPV